MLLGQITQEFVRRLRQYAEQHDIPIIEYKHGQDKDEIANRIRRQRKVRDAVVFIGVAQERAMAFSSKKVNGEFEFNRDKPVYVNHDYGYLDDQDFGPGFLKICSYAPWGIRLCFNGHAWAKRQLDRQGIAFEALDNGFRWCK